MDLLFVSPFFEGTVKAAVEKALANSLLLCVVIVDGGSMQDQMVWQDAQLADKMRREVRVHTVWCCLFVCFLLMRPLLLLCVRGFVCVSFRRWR